MCGIVGAIAERNVVPILMEGLRRLEYRGYDSAGIAVLNGTAHLKRLRTVGKVKVLQDAINADHTHGIDDLRSVVMHQRKRIPVYLNRSTGKDILTRFAYCFEQAPGSDYPAILEKRSIEAGETETIEGKGGSLALTAFLFQHGNIPALGYRIGDAAYTPDLHDIPEESWSTLENLDLWIIDALRYAPHSSHFNVDDALAWINKFKPRRAVLTNLHSDLDYEELRGKLPDGVVPGFDGMRLAVKA